MLPPQLFCLASRKCHLGAFTSVAFSATLAAMRNVVDLKKLLSERQMRLADLARELKVDKSIVTRWAQRQVPAERMSDVSHVTGIPIEKLRPDLFVSRQTEAAE